MFNLSKTRCSNVILFKFCMTNPLLSWPYLVKKKGNFCKNYTLVWAKKVERMPLFFRFLTKKSLLSCPYFFKITSILWKAHCSVVIFFNFLWGTLYSHAHILSKKRQPCKHSPARKVNFTKKSMLPCHANILSKNFHSLKNTMFPCPILSKKPPFF